MSHLINSIEGVTPASNGVIPLGLSPLITGTPSAGQFLGFDGSGQPAPYSPTAGSGLSVVYSVNMGADSWGGGSTAWNVGDRLAWRRASSIEVLDSTYVSVSYVGYSGYTTWGDQITLSAGNYIVLASFSVGASGSNYLKARLRNVTDSAYVGAPWQVGAGRWASSCQSYVSISASKDFQFYIYEELGTTLSSNPEYHSGTHINVIKVG